MATTITFKDVGNPQNGPSSENTGTVDLADVVVNVAPNSTGGWTTATVTADKQRSIKLSAADAATAGVRPGWYDKESGTTFRRATYT